LKQLFAAQTAGKENTKQIRRTYDTVYLVYGYAIGCLAFKYSDCKFYQSVYTVSYK